MCAFAHQCSLTGGATGAAGFGDAALDGALEAVLIEEGEAVDEGVHHAFPAQAGLLLFRVVDVHTAPIPLLNRAPAAVWAPAGSQLCGCCHGDVAAAWIV